MGIIASIDVGLTAGLPANIPLPGKRSRGLIFIRLTCLTGALAAPGRQPVPRARPAGFFSFSAWPAVIAEAAVLLLACHLLTRQSGRFGGFTRRWDIQLADTMKRAMARQPRPSWRSAPRSSTPRGSLPPLPPAEPP